jgi:F-type H+/Na+-transporting ATPase subunit beta
MSEFYAYDNHHRDRARVHRAECPWCNHGQGVQGGSSGASDQWHGPFNTAENAYASVHHRADVSYCAFCRRSYRNGFSVP